MFTGVSHPPVARGMMWSIAQPTHAVRLTSLDDAMLIARRLAAVARIIHGARFARSWQRRMRRQRHEVHQECNKGFHTSAVSIPACSPTWPVMGCTLGISGFPDCIGLAWSGVMGLVFTPNWPD